MLFQLKHQDPYGGDMRRRSNRAGRLRTEVARWLEAIRTWRAEEPGALRRALRLGSGVACEQVYLVVIAKHFAHFLSTVDLRDDASYATWVQVFDALNRQNIEGGQQSLLGLFDILQRFMSHKMARGYAYDLHDSYHLPGLSYCIRGAEQDAPTKSSGDEGTSLARGGESDA